MASVIIMLGRIGYASHSSDFDPFMFNRELTERTDQRSNQGNKWVVQPSTLS